MLEKFNTIRKNNKKIGVECTRVTRVTHRSEDTRMIQLWYDRCQSMMLGLGKILSKGYEYAISRHASFIGKPLVHDKSRNYSGP